MYELKHLPKHPQAHKNGQIYIHRLVAEKTLGKPLPAGCEVHHYSDTELIICENHAYHFLLHRRTRALKACKHAGWRKCQFCKQYDKPENLKIYGRHAYHAECVKQYKLNKKKREP